MHYELYERDPFANHPHSKRVKNRIERYIPPSHRLEMPVSLIALGKLVGHLDGWRVARKRNKTIKRDRK